MHIVESCIFLSLFWLSPKLSFVMELTSLSLLLKALHSRVFVSPIIWNGILYMCWVGHGLCLGILSIVFIRIHLSFYPLEAVDYYFGYTHCQDFELNVMCLWWIWKRHRLFVSSNIIP
jgi:hypothetical protein